MSVLTAYLSWALAALRRAVGTARLSDAHVGLTDAAAPRSPATNSAAVGAASLAARVAAACCGCASTVSAPTEHTAAPPDDYSDLPGMLTHPDLGGVILGWIADDTGTATALRGVSRGCRDGVAAHAWADEDARIGSPARWRAAFPAARVANVSRNKRLCDADFVHFRGIHTLITWSCKQPAITDAAFGHLVGIHSLYMGGSSGSSSSVPQDGAGGHDGDDGASIAGGGHPSQRVDVRRQPWARRGWPARALRPAASAAGAAPGARARSTSLVACDACSRLRPDSLCCASGPARGASCIPHGRPAAAPPRRPRRLLEARVEGPSTSGPNCPANSDLSWIDWAWAARVSGKLDHDIDDHDS